MILKQASKREVVSMGCCSDEETKCFSMLFVEAMIEPLCVCVVLCCVALRRVASHLLPLPGSAWNPPNWARVRREGSRGSLALGRAW